LIKKMERIDESLLNNQWRKTNKKRLFSLGRTMVFIALISLIIQALPTLAEISKSDEDLSGVEVGVTDDQTRELTDSKPTDTKSQSSSSASSPESETSLSTLKVTVAPIVQPPQASTTQDLNIWLPISVRVDPRARSTFFPRIFVESANTVLVCISSTSMGIDIGGQGITDDTNDGDVIIEGDQTNFLRVAGPSSVINSVINGSSGIRVFNLESGIAGQYVMFRFVDLTKSGTEQSLCSDGILENVRFVQVTPLGITQNITKGKIYLQKEWFLFEVVATFTSRGLGLGVAPINSPLSGKVSGGFGGGGRVRNRFLLGISVIAIVPFLFTTFAANVTVGQGALEFGQGSQQTVACDPSVYVALGEEWLSSPLPEDPTYGFFRVRSVTVANLDLLACRDKKLRIRLIDTNGQEIPIGSVPEARAIQMVLPNSDAPVNTSDVVALRLTYLTGDGQVISGALAASAAVTVVGTSVYDGSLLSPQNADVTYYLDPLATTVNINGQLVGRTTVETVNNAQAQS
jgi:hypothetical protein